MYPLNNDIKVFFSLSHKYASTRWQGFISEKTTYLLLRLSFASLSKDDPPYLWYAGTSNLPLSNVLFSTHCKHGSYLILVISTFGMDCLSPPTTCRWLVWMLLLQTQHAVYCCPSHIQGNKKSKRSKVPCTDPWGTPQVRLSRITNVFNVFCWFCYNISWCPTMDQ